METNLVRLHRAREETIDPDFMCKIINETGSSCESLLAVLK
jgi:hypothetical protein